MILVGLDIRKSLHRLKRTLFHYLGSSLLVQPPILSASVVLRGAGNGHLAACEFLLQSDPGMINALPPWHVVL